MSRTRQLQGSGSAGHPVGSPCKGLLAPASRQPLPALPPPCRQAGKQVPASRRPHCQQACSAQQRAGSQAPVPGGGSTWQACPAQQQAGSQAPVSSFPCVSRVALHSSGAGSQVPVSSFPCASRLPLQAGWRADGPLPQDFFLTTPSARLLPQDFLFKTSPGQPGSDTTGARFLPQDSLFKTSPGQPGSDTTGARFLPQDSLFKTSPGQPGSDTTEARFLPQDLQRADSSPCRLFLAVACKHVFSNLQCSNYYIRRP